MERSEQMRQGSAGRRAYATGEARFITQVRMEEMLAGEHPYAYAFNNPTTYTDPSGLAPCSPASPCATFPGGPCAYAKSIGDDHGDGGGSVCCDGVMYPCVWDVPPGYPPGIAKCMLLHERLHTVQQVGDCPPSGYGGRGQRHGPGSECGPSAGEIACESKQKGIDCGKLIGTARLNCEKIYHDRICQMCKYMTSNHCPSLPSICKYCP